VEAMTSERERNAKQDIAEVLVRYATGIDSRDWALFRSCFHPDVRAEYDGIATWNGSDAITTFMIDAHAGMGHTLHKLSNFAIRVDGNRATARSYVDAILMAEDGQTGLNPIGFYDDDFVDTEEGWCIAVRRFTMVHSRELG
jgi:hypothetical protein